MRSILNKLNQVWQKHNVDILIFHLFRAQYIIQILSEPLNTHKIRLGWLCRLLKHA